MQYFVRNKKLRGINTSFPYSSGFHDVHEITDYCDILDGDDKISRLLHSVLHADVQLLDAVFDSRGFILGPILELLDVHIYRAIQLADIIFAGSNILDIKNQINAGVTVFIQIIQNTIYLILGDVDWLNGLNVNGQLCTELRCWRRIIF